MNLLQPATILAYQSRWTAGSAFLCIGVLALVALIRSHLSKGEGAH